LIRGNNPAHPVALVPATLPSSRKLALESFRDARLGLLVLHAALFAGLAAWSWLKWPDAFIDFGRELYVPWQIVEGKVLYRDVESLFGPFSPYLNALWFRLFGVSLRALVFANLAIFAAILAGIYMLVRQYSDVVTAASASLTTLAFFGFLQLVGVGNYNFATPYAHDATHGLALSVLVLLAWHTAIVRERLASACLSGLAFGCVVLTKPEILVAALAAVLAGTVAATVLDSAGRRVGRVSLVWVMSSLVAPLLFFFYLRIHVGEGAAFRATMRALTAPLDADGASNPFYLAGMGLDEPLLNAFRMFAAFAGFALFVVLVAAGSWRGRGSPFPRWAHEPAGVAAVLLAPLAYWLNVARALPLIVFATVAVVAISLWKRRGAGTGRAPLLLFAWGVFALGMLLKLGLNARVHHYGFYLALPAMTVVVTVLCWGVPAYLASRASAHAASRARVLGATALVAAGVPLLAASNGAYQSKVLPIGSGPDRFYADADSGSRGAAVSQALEAIRSLASPGDGLAVLPEGVMLNYLARLHSPLRVVNLMPPEWTMFGEDAVLRDLQAAPPRFVVLTHKDMREYGYPLFGADARYGRRTVRWILERYHQAHVVGDRPLDPSGWGMVLLERSPPR
jgi:hypothetical protein